MRTSLHAFSVLLLVSVAAAAQQRPAPRRVPQRSRPAPGPAYMAELRSYDEAPHATRAVLKNGFTVLVQEFHAHPVVALLAYVKSGSGDPPDRTSAATRPLCLP